MGRWGGRCPDSGTAGWRNRGVGAVARKSSDTGATGKGATGVG